MPDRTNPFSTSSQLIIDQSIVFMLLYLDQRAILRRRRCVLTRVSADRDAIGTVSRPMATEEHYEARIPDHLGREYRHPVGDDRTTELRGKRADAGRDCARLATGT